MAKNPNVSGATGVGWHCRRTMARLGDGDALQEILGELNAKDGVTVESAVRNLEYIDDPRNMPRLFGLLTDKRVGFKMSFATDTKDWETGAALDYVAARAIFNLSRTKPEWPLTAPGGKLSPKGVHPENRSERGGMATKHYDTLSEEQREEVVMWAKRFEAK